MVDNVIAVLEKFERAASSPHEVAREWKAKGGKVVGSFAMHFPSEIAHAAGALPSLLQASNETITEGLAGMYPFFCSYTRSMVDQNLKGQFDHLDCIMFGDHCVQLLSAADVIRVQNPDLHVGFYQLIPAIRDNWSFDNAELTLRNLIEGIEEQLGVTITEENIRNSICIYNKNRQLIRKLYDLRRDRKIRLTSVQMQNIIKSSMVMDKAEHNALLEELVAEVEANQTEAVDIGVPMFLSGHLCHSAKQELLDLIEECGITVVDDDLYHGFRYVSVDAEETGDPVKSLTHWYLDRNTVVPCPTRMDPEVDWDGWLYEAVHKANAAGLIILLPKYCEPHYFMYPAIKKTFQDNDFPHLLLETEHDMPAIASLRIRIESFVEMVQHKSIIKSA